MSFEDAFERGQRRALEAMGGRAPEAVTTDDVVTPLGAYGVEQAALDGLEAGLCVIRASIDGTKAPLGQWKQWQSAAPTHDQVVSWFADGHPGLGVVTGAVSGNLELLEFEGRAVADGVVDRFKDALRAAGLWDDWHRIAHGYSEQTPSGGFHVLWRCEEIAGNTKLARRPSAVTGEVEVLIETRGEGGFVVCAPSNGPTHPTGRPWERLHGSFTTIAAIHPELRRRILGIARSFDELPDVEIPRAKPIGDKGDGGTLPGFNLSVEEVLRSAGFTLHHQDRDGNQHWTRPGKDPAEGHSLTIWGDDGRCTPWSTSIDMPGEFITGKRLLTAWQLHVGLNHNGDFTEAARTWAGVDSPPMLGEIHLDDDFWSSRELFSHVLQFARARRCSPWAVLGVVLVRIAAAIPPAVVLPPLVGGHLSLNTYLGLVGKSGSGKDAAMSAAQEAYDVGRVKAVGLGSGEGILDQYIAWKHAKNGEEGGLEQHTTSVIFTAPEIESLGALKGRSSATLMPELRKAWMGSALGFAYANRERRLFLDPHTYRLGLVVGIQPENSHVLLDETSGGTPQRFLWMPAVDPHAPDEAPPEPSRIAPFGLPELPKAQRGYMTLEVCQEAAEAVDEARVARLRDEGEALDGHALACRLKVAALLAIADGRIDVADDDWRLAGAIQAVSNQTRAAAVAAVQEVARRSNLSHGEARAQQQIIVAERLRDHDAEALERVASVLLTRLTDDWLSRGALRISVTSRDRDRFDEAIACLVDTGKVECDEVEYRGHKTTKFRLARVGH